jgi:hypothetical protein
MRNITELKLLLKYDNIFKYQELIDSYFFYKNNKFLFSKDLELLNWYNIGTATKYDVLFIGAGFFKSVLTNKLEETYLFLRQRYKDDKFELGARTIVDFEESTQIKPHILLSDIEIVFCEDHLKSIKKMNNISMNLLNNSKYV